MPLIFGTYSTGQVRIPASNAINTTERRETIIYVPMTSPWVVMKPWQSKRQARRPRTFENTQDFHTANNCFLAARNYFSLSVSVVFMSNAPSIIILM